MDEKMAARMSFANPKGIVTSSPRLRGTSYLGSRFANGIQPQRGCASCDALHSYLGGVEDHVHLLARCGRALTQAEWVKELKRVSNLWLKERGRDYANFEWQGGCADFSVSQSNLEPVKQYIAGQEEHHRKIGFQDKLRALLRKHEIEWDAKYVWD